jgi:putative FmdB family regulatory protein
VPLYEYVCTKCGTPFEAFNRVSERQSAPCPNCNYMAQKILSVPTLDKASLPSHWESRADELQVTFGRRPKSKQDAANMAKGSDKFLQRRGKGLGAVQSG